MLRAKILFFLFGLTITFSGQNLNSSPNNSMTLVPEGYFQMGIDTSKFQELLELGKDVPHITLGHVHWWFGDETPKHFVHVDSFYIDKYEVTNAEFKNFVDQTGYQAEGDWLKYFSKERLNHPVVNVTWNDANAYAKWAGKRLPSEAEWEYAAKAGNDSTLFPWGNTIDSSKANYRYMGETFFQGLARMLGLRKMGDKPVDSYEPNAFGIYNLIGNVSEWCYDEYKPYKGSTWQLDKEDYGKRVVRGGNWETPNPVFMRTTNRSGKKPSTYSRDVGFRCAKNLH